MTIKKLLLLGILFASSELASAKLAGHIFFTPYRVNWDITTEPGLYLSPACIRKKGMELVIIDPGHDDSSASRRSDVNGSFRWMEVHEGQSNMLSSYLALEYALTNPRLTASERRELRMMIRLTRYPGEKYFGDYESKHGYGSRGGLITAGVENRASRINYMADYHRPFDQATQAFSTTRKIDVTGKSIMVSVHANSTDAWDSGDHIWIIPPKSSADSTLINSMKLSFSETWTDFFKVLSTDSSADAALKRGAAGSAALSRIKTGTHSVNLAVLGSSVAMTRKTLLEGWVMNGKVGHLAYNDIKINTPREQLYFERSGVKVMTYDVSEAYKTYAKAIVRGLNKYFACGQ